MLIDTKPVSRWYVMNKGFKTKEACSVCLNPDLTYYKVLSKGYRGTTSECNDCGKKFPFRLRANMASQERRPEEL